jgi:two-component system KDP operon response regulator KdpE
MSESIVLVIDDEAQIRRVVRNALAADFDRVSESETAADGIDQAAAQHPRLIILDLGLPDAEGADVCRELRRWSTAPILVLSARHSEEEKVTLLDLGADDYVTKPFSTKEFQARARALMRRAEQGAGGEARQIRSGPLTVDLHKRIVTLDNAEIHLTPTEYELLRVLASNAGRTMTHRQLFGEVWSGRTSGDAQAYLRVHIANLRHKLERDPLAPRYIITEPGVGYRFVIHG